MSIEVPFKVVAQGLGQAKQGFGQFITNLNQGLQAVDNIVGKISRSFERMGDLMTDAQRAGAMRSSFSALSESIGGAEATLQAMRGASAGLIDDITLMEIANKALQLGIVDSTDQMADLTEAAVVLGRSMGLETSRAVDNLVTALGRQSALVLDNLGIIVKNSEAYDNYAKQLGVTTKQLTDAQKAEAWRAEALRKASERVEELGGLTKVAGDEWQRLDASLTNAQNNMKILVAEGLDPVLTDIQEWVDKGPEATEIASGISVALGMVGEEVDRWAERKRKHGGPWGGFFTYPVDMVTGAVSGWKMFAEDVTNDLASIGRVWEQVEGHVEDVQQETAKLAAAAKKPREEVKKLEEGYIKVGEATYKIGTAIETVDGINKGWMFNAETGWRDMNVSFVNLSTGARNIAKGMRLAEKDTGGFIVTANGGFARVGAKASETAERIEKKWREAIAKIVGEIKELEIEVIGSNTGMMANLQEQFGDLFSESDLELATWIDEEMKKLEEEKALRDPVAEQVGEGMADGLSQGVEDEGPYKFLGTKMRITMMDAMLDPEIRARIAEGMGMTLRHSINTALATTDPREMLETVSKRKKGRMGRRNIDDIVEEFGTLMGGTQELEGVLNLIAGKDKFGARQLVGTLQSSIIMSRRFQTAPGNMKRKAEMQQRLSLIQDLFDIFDFEIPGFGRGGVANFGPGALALLHGNEAILPLDEGGGAAVREVVWGGEAKEMLGSLGVMIASAVDRRGEEQASRLASLVAIAERQLQETIESRGEIAKRYLENRNKAAMRLQRSEMR
jgi:hypothetical protein